MRPPGYWLASIRLPSSTNCMCMIYTSPRAVYICTRTHFIPHTSHPSHLSRISLLTPSTPSPYTHPSLLDILTPPLIHTHTYTHTRTHAHTRTHTHHRSHTHAHCPPLTPFTARSLYLLFPSFHLQNAGQLIGQFLSRTRAFLVYRKCNNNNK